MTTKHPEAFIEQALVKAFSRGDRFVVSVAENLNINHHALRHWIVAADTKLTPWGSRLHRR